MHKEHLKYRIEIKFCDALEKARREGERERSSRVDKFSFLISSLPPPYFLLFFALTVRLRDDNTRMGTSGQFSNNIIKQYCH